MTPFRYAWQLIRRRYRHWRFRPGPGFYGDDAASDICVGGS